MTATTIPEESELEWITRAQQDDRQAFAELVHRCGHFVERLERSVSVERVDIDLPRAAGIG